MLPKVFSHPTTWPRESERPFAERAIAKQVELTVESVRRERDTAPSPIVTPSVRGAGVERACVSRVPDEQRDGGESAVAAAYAHVARGYEAALTVPGLPLVEVEDLRAVLRAARELAQLPQLTALQ